MKRHLIIGALTMALALALAPHALAASATEQFPSAVVRSEDGGEIRKLYDLSPEDDPAGIPRSDFEQDGWHYTLADLLKQELPEHESRPHTETVTVQSKNKDMASVLALLPETREFITEDGLKGTLTLKLDSVNVEPAGYGSSTKALTATRSYPGLASQDTQYLPKTIEENKNTLTLQSVDWKEESGGHYTATATYTGSTTSSYVKGYIITADYAGTVSRINLNTIRYVAIFEGTPLAAEEPPAPEVPAVAERPSVFRWAYVLIPLGIIAAAGAGVGGALLWKRRQEEDGGDEE